MVVCHVTRVLPLAREIWEPWCVSDTQIWYILACKERHSRIMSRTSVLIPQKCLFVFWGQGWVNGSHSLAGDASPWWKPWHLFCSQEFDHIQKVRVLIPGLHHLDNFCEGRQSKHYGYKSGSVLMLEFRVTLEQQITSHFHINLLLQLCLLLQCLLWHLGGAREADNDDADVIQASLQGETEHRIIREALRLQSSDILKFLYFTRVFPFYISSYFYLHFNQVLH